MSNDLLDDETQCAHELDAPIGQALVGVHEVLEIVRVDGRDIARRCEIHACPDHIEAIRRARAYSEEPAKLVRLMDTAREEPC